MQNLTRMELIEGLEILIDKDLIKSSVRSTLKLPFIEKHYNVLVTDVFHGTKVINSLAKAKMYPVPIRNDKPEDFTLDKINLEILHNTSGCGVGTLREIGTQYATYLYNQMNYKEKSRFWMNVILLNQ